MIKRISFNGAEIAIIISSKFTSPGVTFVTDDSYSQQLAYMNRPQDEYIRPHYHNLNERAVRFTQEVLVIKSGRMRADFYTSEKEYIGSEELGAGDVLMLTSGGHAFKMLEPVEMLEVKQGPYARAEDKTIFEGASEDQIVPLSPDHFSIDQTNK
ncbi:hypothetical protein DSM25558_2728 [Agrobacterium sp. DSM 25558]|uniref:hypothetical protein n=1 Tax=Agrobacterium sp. DSM 25558 TaxID=1907665 RepID=UPI0009724B40|nr:hypothetical protein [Agrobacterium sp. DSM 25558]SCX20352.1 hypothetical protein DSM25558_2728 [Agrobacterium sp. DSM 25558]